MQTDVHPIFLAGVTLPGEKTGVRPRWLSRPKADCDHNPGAKLILYGPH